MGAEKGNLMPHFAADGAAGMVGHRHGPAEITTS